MRGNNSKSWLALAAIGLLGSAACRMDENLNSNGTAEPTGPREQSVVPTGGLVGEWKLDGNVTDTKNGFNATLFGNPPYIAAKIGQGLDLTGNGTGGQGGKYVEMPSNTTLDNLSEGAAYSISGWFNPASSPSGTSPSVYWMVVGKTNAQATGILFNMNQKFLARHFLTGNVLQLATATSTSTLNQWHHVVEVVTKGSATVSGSLKLYVDGALSQTETWAGGTAAKDFGTAKWRIGKSDNDWSANGRADQVRFYNVALTQADVTSLFQEGAPLPVFRFPVGMAKDQLSDIGTDAFAYNPDGKVSAIGQDMGPTLSYAKPHGARVIVTVTGADNPNLRNADGTFSMTKWKARFDAASAATSATAVRNWVRDGTLVGIFVLDEPWLDFTNFSYSTLDDLCQYVKASWPWVSCLVREDNWVIDENTPANYTFQYLDAGWSQASNFTVNQYGGGNIQTYFQNALDIGASHGLGVWYGFNLLKYANKANTGCTGPEIDPGYCAITPAQLRAVADAIEAIGSGKGCGVSGWFLDNAAGPDRNYFLSGTGIPSALQYLWDHTAGRTPAIQPGPCNIRGDLPAP